MAIDLKRFCPRMQNHWQNWIAFETWGVGVILSEYANTGETFPPRMQKPY